VPAAAIPRAGLDSEPCAQVAIIADIILSAGGKMM
jgi:hypothetical protein